MSQVVHQSKASSFDKFQSKQREAKSSIKQEIGELFLSNEGSFWGDLESLEIVDSKDVAYLEKNGIFITAFNEEHPYGTYAEEYIENLESAPKETIFRFTKLNTKLLSLVPQPPEKLTKEELNSSPFEYIPTSTHALATYKNGKWGETLLVPASKHTMNGITATTQYGQGAFEGMVACRVDSDSKVCIFRPEENAQRFNGSLARVGIPPISLGQFISAIEHVVKANKRYIPDYGAPARLYLRPYVSALNGGTNVKSATELMFKVEAFPFASYASQKPEGIDIVTISGTQRAISGMGDKKVIGNYAGTIPHGADAKSGTIKEYPGQKFDGVYYTYKMPGQKESFVEEYSAANIFFIQNDNDEITIYTPSLASQRILPGVTRDSCITLLRSKGHKVKQGDISLAEISNMDAAFLTGSAAGITKLASMTSQKGKSSFPVSEKCNEIMDSLFNELTKIRQGDVESYKGSKIEKWPHIIKL